MFAIRSVIADSTPNLRSNYKHPCLQCHIQPWGSSKESDRKREWYWDKFELSSLDSSHYINIWFSIPNRPRLTEAKYQSSRIGVVSEGWGRQIISSSFLRMDSEGGMFWKQSSGIIIEAGWGYSYFLMSNSPSSLSPLLFHEDNARSCLSTSPRVKRTSHLARPPLLLR